jgi:hypothetical protein
MVFTGISATTLAGHHRGFTRGLLESPGLTVVGHWSVYQKIWFPESRSTQF